MKQNVADFIRDHNDEDSDAANVESLFAAGNSPEKRRAEAWLKQRIMEASRLNEPISKSVSLTPELAELLLQRNPDNRNVSERTVSDFVRDIENGAFEFNGEPIIVSKEGLLNDGQHRCTAVIRAARPIDTLIVFGVSRDSRKTVDQGKARTTGDFLSMEGIDNANQMAAAGRLVLQYYRYGYLSAHPEYRTTKQESLEFVRDHPDLQESIRAVPTKGSRVLGSRSRLVFCHYIFSKYDPQDADEFISKLIKGYELRRHDPIQVCRERLISGNKLTAMETVELIFRAWKAHREGRDVSKLAIHGQLPKLGGR